MLKKLYKDEYGSSPCPSPRKEEISAPAASSKTPEEPAKQGKGSKLDIDDYEDDFEEDDLPKERSAKN